MIGLLERRLDAVVYRAKFVPTPFAARQLVSHGHVKVNGRRVTIASYQVKEGDTIELTPKARDMALVLEAAKSARARRARLRRSRPRQDDARNSCARRSSPTCRTPSQMQPHLIVEFYSR